DALPCDHLESTDILEAGDAAGGDHRNAGLGHREGGCDVDSAHHAVTLDVGVDDGADPIGGKPPGQVDRPNLGDLGPTIGGDQPGASIDADDDATREIATGTGDEFRFPYRPGPDDDVAHSRLQIGFDGLCTANASADLHRQLRVLPSNGA